VLQPVLRNAGDYSSPSVGWGYVARASVLLLRVTGPGASMVFRSVSGHSGFAGAAEASLCDCVNMEQSICTDSGVYACGNN
jgi:hypothetical protein